MQITLTELRRTPAPALDAVRSGDEVLVTDDGKPFLRMVPAALPTNYERLLASGAVRRGQRSSTSIEQLRAAIEQRVS